MKHEQYEGNGCRGVLNALGIMALVFILVFLAFDANAGGYKEEPKIELDQDQHQKQYQGQDQGQLQKQTATADSAVIADIAATSGSESAADSTSSNGDMLSTNSSQFYALSLMFPGASDCFTGAQGGANDTDADKGVSAFLGIHLLNTSCWLDKLASQESDINLNARLKCGDKKYRNAIAYDVPKKERQARCISMKVASGTERMQSYKDRMQGLLDKANEDKQTLLDLRDLDRAVCKESIERCEERLRK